MNLQDLLSNPQIVDQLARSVGVDERQARTGLEALLPAVSQGLRRNSRDSGGLESLVKALESGQHQRYVERPELLAEGGAREEGNSILGHIFGSKQVSRNVAGHAAQETGINSDLLKKMLPIVASIAMAALSKRTNSGTEIQHRQQRSDASGADLLGTILGGLTGGGRRTQNDSALDDVLDLAKMFL